MREFWWGARDGMIGALAVCGLSWWFDWSPQRTIALWVVIVAVKGMHWWFGARSAAEEEEE